MTEITVPIPARIKNKATNGHVAGTEDIYDDAKGKTQKEINEDLENAIGSCYTKEETYSKEEIDALIASLLPGLPVSDGSDVDPGTAYIDSTDRTVIVTEPEEEEETIEEP